MFIACRLTLIAVLFALPLLSACGGDDDVTSCSESALCPSGYVCDSGTCRLEDNTGKPNGDGTTTDDDGDSPSTDEGDGDATDEVTPTVDTEGPTIVVNAPEAGSMIGGRLYIEVSVSDVSGVDSNAVSAFIGSTVASGERFTIPLAADGDSGTYYGDFETSQLSTSFTFPHFGVRALDLEGNEREIGFAVSVDNTPPRVGFKSGPVQSTRASSTGRDCSVTYDPLGTVSDGLMIDGEFYDSVNIIPRLRIEDEGNERPPVYVYAGIDDTNARLYFMPVRSSGLRLVTASVSGGRCDTINPAVLPTSTPTEDQAVVYSLVPFNASGLPYFPPSGAAGPICNPVGTDSEPPALICIGGPDTELTHWLTYGLANAPAVYGIEGYDQDSRSAYCTGNVFDIYNLRPGPVCVAAEVYDAVGNVTVTQPIAICIARGGTECSGFDAAAVRASCSDGCSSPNFDDGTPTEEDLD